MKKMTSYNRVQNFIGVLSILSLLLGCTPKFLHYIPDENSQMRIEFEYPSTWALNIPDLGGGSIIGFSDPAKSTSAGIEPNLEQGMILITVESIDPNNFYLEDEIEAKTKKSPYNPEILRDQYFQIDNFPARWLTLKIEPNWVDYLQPMIFEDIFLVTNGQLYRLRLHI